MPRAARRAARVLTVSERSRRDLVELYDVEPGRIVRHAERASTRRSRPPRRRRRRGRAAYALAVGAIQPRKNQEAALAAAREVGLELVVVGPRRRTRRSPTRSARGGARLEGYVPLERLVELYRGAACLVQASRYEGFGLPVLEAMACGTPVVVVDEPALVEVAGDAAVIVAEHELADGIRRALASATGSSPRDSSARGAFSWEATAQAAVRAYREALGR